MTDLEWFSYFIRVNNLTFDEVRCALQVAVDFRTLKLDGNENFKGVDSLLANGPNEPGVIHNEGQGPIVDA